MLTYGGEVVSAHRRGDSWARWRRTCEAQVGDDKAAQRVDPLGVALGEAVLWAGKSFGRCSGRTTAAHWAGKSSGRCSGRTTAAHWAGTSYGWWSGPRHGGGLGVLAAARSSRGGGVELSVGAARSSGRWRQGGSTAQKWLSVGKGGEGKKYMGGPFVPCGATTRDKKALLSRVVAPPGTKGIFGRAGKIPSPRPTFSPGWIYHPGQKGPVFSHSRQILCLFLFLFTSLLK